MPRGNVGIKRQHNRLARARAGVIEFRGIDLAPGAIARFG